MRTSDGATIDAFDLAWALRSGEPDAREPWYRIYIAAA